MPVEHVATTDSALKARLQCGWQETRTLVFLFAKKKCLSPLQVGVGLPGATEAIIHKVREWMRNPPPEHALLQMDFADAYNTIGRTAMFKAIAQRCPKFLPYATFCYGASTPLVADGFCIESCT